MLVLKFKHIQYLVIIENFHPRHETSEKMIKNPENAVTFEQHASHSLCLTADLLGGGYSFRHSPPPPPPPFSLHLPSPLSPSLPSLPSPSLHFVAILLSFPLLLHFSRMHFRLNEIRTSSNSALCI